MLQQTRVEAVLPYYERFLREFPTVERLARAPEAAVLACWSGLGYYSRARAPAPRGATDRRLRLPARLRRASGRCRAWGRTPPPPSSSIAFGLCHPALDGNVMRVVARVSGDPSDIRAARTRRRFEEIVGGWLDPRRPGRTNEALMELGATVCLPREPRCAACPVAAFCRARAEGSTRQLPVKGARARAAPRRGRPGRRDARRPRAAPPARRRRAQNGRLLGTARAGRPPRAPFRAEHRYCPAHHHASPLHHYGRRRTNFRGSLRNALVSNRRISPHSPQHRVP